MKYINSMWKSISIFPMIIGAIFLLGYVNHNQSVNIIQGEWYGMQTGFEGKYTIKFSSSGYFYMKRTYPNSSESIGFGTRKLLYILYPNDKQFKVSIYPENSQLQSSDTLKTIVRILKRGKSGQAEKIEFNLLMLEPGPNDKIILERVNH